jgi:hypothetical protein
VPIILNRHLSVVCICIFLFPVVSTIQPPDPIPSLRPHYRAFITTADRSAPVLRLGTLASRFSPLVLLPCHRRTGSCSSAQKPASNSRPLYAGRRLPSHQAPDRLVPEGIHASGFDDAKVLNDASSVGSLSFVFRMHTCSRSCLELLFQRSPPRLFTAAAWSGLRPAPESRSRGACPHLSRSFTTLFSLSDCPPFYVSLQHTVSRPVGFRHQPLAEPSVRLSPHSAPIRQTCRSY